MNPNPVFSPIGEGFPVPVYEFRCLKCGSEIMLVLSITEYEKGKRKCAECGSTKLERRVSTVTVQTSRKS
jgi:putative FmdB family regulatory protein